MITLASQPKPWGHGTFKFEFEGKSTDEKPVSVYKGMPIANASTFLSIDKQDVNFYDEEKHEWV